MSRCAGPDGGARREIVWLLEISAGRRGSVTFCPRAVSGGRIAGVLHVCPACVWELFAGEAELAGVDNC